MLIIVFGVLAFRSGYPRVSVFLMGLGLASATGLYVGHLYHRLRRSQALLLEARRRYSELHEHPDVVRRRALTALSRLEHEHARKHREALEALERQRRDLEHVQTTLLENLTHEIRTPLTGILGYVSILEDLLEQPERSLTQPIRTNAEQLLETLNALITLAYLEREAVRIAPEPTVAAPLLEPTLTTFQEQARRKGLRLDVHIADEQACALLDARGLNLILFHLLSNAIKFTEQGGIFLEVRSDDRWVHFIIRDTGIGIDPAFLPHLFEPFRQASTGETRRYRGNGVGLTIVKKMVDLMQGEITVTSVPGQGSVFTVRFPRVAAPARPVPLRRAA
ncbi:MAG: hypothetical protein KatS3mg042_1189 [Rhodothermaceae bacterium]|nr:MAG: hypothetical protein KatS3mg042_1189 [Rhodothermaceae bacterium]